MDSRNRWRAATPFRLALLAVAALSGCSSTSDGTPAADGTAATHADVAVTLKEFAITVTPASMPAGHVTFTTQNAGAIPHELVVVKSDLLPDQLPQVNQKVVDVVQVQVIAETEPFDSGTKRELTADLQPGKYILLCNVESHYISGMHTAFTVTAAH